MAAVPGGNRSRPRRAGRSMLGGLGGQGSRPAGVTTKVRFAPGVYAGGGTKGDHQEGTVPVLVPPAAPAWAEAIETDETEATLNWEAPAYALHDQPYQYRYGTTNPPTGDPIEVEGTTVTITGLTPGTGYRFQVRARSATDKYSSWSTALLGTTQEQP